MLVNTKIISSSILLSTLLWLACTKTSTPPDRTATSTFPLTTDSKWHYQGYIYYIPFNDSSLADTIQLDIIRYVVGPDTLLNLPELVVVDDTVISEIGTVIDTSIFRHWLRIDEQRLKEYAHVSFGIGSDPDPYLYDPPYIILDFPLSDGKEWIAFSSDFGAATSAVVGQDRIVLDFSSFVCDVLFTRLNLSEDFTFWAAYEWYSDEGLIRKEIEYSIGEIVDEGGTVLDSARLFETWELIDMEIQNDE